MNWVPTLADGRQEAVQKDPHAEANYGYRLCRVARSGPDPGCRKSTLWGRQRGPSRPRFTDPDENRRRDQFHWLPALTLAVRAENFFGQFRTTVGDEFGNTVD